MCFSLGSENNNNKVGIIDIAQAKTKRTTKGRNNNLGFSDLGSHPYPDTDQLKHLRQAFPWALGLHFLSVQRRDGVLASLAKLGR